MLMGAVINRGHSSAERGCKEVMSILMMTLSASNGQAQITGTEKVSISLNNCRAGRSLGDSRHRAADNSLEHSAAFDAQQRLMPDNQMQAFAVCQRIVRMQRVPCHAVEI